MRVENKDGQFITHEPKVAHCMMWCRIFANRFTIDIYSLGIFFCAFLKILLNTKENEGVDIKCEFNEQMRKLHTCICKPIFS